MRALYWIVGVAIVAVGGFYLVNNYIYMEKQGDPNPAAQSPQVTPISHATFVLRWGNVTLYNDPTGSAAAFAGQPQADMVLVSDIHGDHLSTSTLASVTGANTTLVVPQAVKDQLPAELVARAKVLNNGESLTERGLTITAVPMYNLPDAQNSNFHTKGRGNGYLVSNGNYTVYIAGDTAGTPEMRALTNVDMAFIPMNLPYTMSVEEAADAVLAFKPMQVYPYHYRGPEGLADVNKFKSLVNAGNPDIEVILANWYSQQ